jgi:hypothetical protein
MSEAVVHEPMAGQDPPYEKTGAEAPVFVFACNREDQ